MSDLDPQARALLEAARRGGRTVPPARRGRMRRAVLAVLALSSTATAGSLTLGKVVLVALASAAVGSGVTAAVTHSLDARASRGGPGSQAPAVRPAEAVISPAAVAEEGDKRAALPAAPLAPAAPERSVPAAPSTDVAHEEEQRPAPSTAAADSAPVEGPRAGGDPPPEDGRPSAGGRPSLAGSRFDPSPRPRPSDAQSRSAAALLQVGAALTSSRGTPEREHQAAELETPEIPPPPPPQAVSELRRGGEAEALMRVYVAVVEQRWADATTALDSYGRHFERGSLTAEADVLRVLLLCGEGQTEAASALARRLAGQAPMNPAVQRLQPACAALETPR